MAIQLTRQQQERIQAVVERGAYGSTEEAVEAAVSALESAAAPGFEGTPEELEALLAEGLASGEPVEADDGNNYFDDRTQLGHTNRVNASGPSIMSPHVAGFIPLRITVALSQDPSQ